LVISCGDSGIGMDAADPELGMGGGDPELGMGGGDPGQVWAVVIQN
jgi:hypothetical protein